ncbi:MAG: MipA/OmpV family protein [Micropepsaceae bacterium]
MKTALACLAAACALALTTADAAPKPKWEIGVGAVGTYGPAFWGASREADSFSGFPVAYVVYRGKNFSILPDGVFGIDAGNTERFSFSLSIDGSGGVDSEDRYGLGDIDPVLEAGPEIKFALLANGSSRLEVGLAARAAYQLGEGFEGWVIEPSVSYLFTLTDTTRMRLTAAAKWGSRDYNDLWYSDGFYIADSGYIGASFAIAYVNDLTDRLRLSAQAKVMTVDGSEMDDFASLVQDDTNYSFRIGFTYAIWQSSAMTDD